MTKKSPFGAKIMKTTELKKEWSNIDKSVVKKAITKYLNSRALYTYHSGDRIANWNCNTYSDYDSLLGFAYTSSSDYAGLWICNTELYLDIAKQYKLQGFALDNSGFVYAIWCDISENELITPIN